MAGLVRALKYFSPNSDFITLHAVSGLCVYLQMQNLDVAKSRVVAHTPDPVALRTYQRMQRRFNIPSRCCGVVSCALTHEGFSIGMTKMNGNLTFEWFGIEGQSVIPPRRAFAKS